ncbi:MAG: 40S ribosomal protein S17 [Candidatus Parvarchaeota archaeon]|jgi:small subunit ribosomal protein S17e|nr:40S ribosomal protein S17 [Candidatus Parvarchaeota archaeon]MCL5017870.1 40S ribosomal protein S17 [Candidatus Parvarchaeota archaeon]
MGRVRGKLVRNASLDILKLYKGRFTDDYAANKQVLNEVITSSKRVRNKIAGYITKLAKDKKIEELLIANSTK